MFDQNDAFLNALILFSRILLSLPFLYSGIDKCLHWTSAQREVAASGLPWPTLLHLVTVALHLNFAVIGGLSMVIALGSGRVSVVDHPLGRLLELLAAMIGAAR